MLLIDECHLCYSANIMCNHVQNLRKVLLECTSWLQQRNCHFNDK